MSVGSWVAGNVRAQLLAAERTVGPAVAGSLAAGTYAEALVRLARTPYRREIRHDLPLEQAQRAVVATTLLNLRILAGWLPGNGLPPLRALAAWFELCNLEDRVAYLAGGELRRPFELGSLAVAWPRAAGTGTVSELRDVLAASPWGDPDGRTPGELGLGLRLAWARRIEREVPEAERWAAAAAALLLARALFVDGIPVDVLPLPRPRLLGVAWEAAATFDRFTASLPPAAAWIFAVAPEPRVLWRAEAAWWRAVAADGAAMLRGSAMGRRRLVGATAVLAADAHDVVSALAAAARRSLPGVEEVAGAAG